jgi:hypothetical protein
MHPQYNPTNDGWEMNKKKHVLKNAKWPIVHENHPQLEFVIASIAPYANYFAHNKPYIEIKSFSLKLFANEKGKNPMKESLSSETSKLTFVHSKASTKELQGEGKNEISHLHMFPQISRH